LTFAQGGVLAVSTESCHYEYGTKREGLPFRFERSQAGLAHCNV